MTIYRAEERLGARRLLCRAQIKRRARRRVGNSACVSYNEINAIRASLGLMFVLRFLSFSTLSTNHNFHQRRPSLKPPGSMHGVINYNTINAFRKQIKARDDTYISSRPGVIDWSSPNVNKDDTYKLIGKCDIYFIILINQYRIDILNLGLGLKITAVVKLCKNGTTLHTS